MNLANFLPVSAVLVGFILLVLTIIIGSCIVATGFSKGWRKLIGLLSIVALVSLEVWIVINLSKACDGKEIDYFKDYEVKTVIFPDGKNVQMFNMDGVNVNANKMLGAIVPEDCVIRRYVYKKEYNGIYFTYSRLWLEDSFEVVKKDASKTLLPL